MRRTTSWLSNSLSFGGRLQLLASVLFSIQVFWCSTFVLPVAVTKECDRILRTFLWHGVGNSKKGGKVAWSKVCCPKEEGGLGIKDARSWNRAAIMKIGWDICRRKVSVWTNWCYAVLLKNKHFWAAPITGACSWSWRNILHMREVMIHKVLYEVKDENLFSLWFDPWYMGASIVDKFGTTVIQESEIPRDANISSVISEGRWNWPRNSWDLIQISNSTAALPLQTGSDMIHWMKKGCTFSLNEAWRAFIPHSPIVPWSKVVLFPRRIPKHSFCLWLTFRDGHKMLDKMHRLGMVQSVRCDFRCG
ncbi:zf-RVT domain-containing protein [Cephalotus follicularis]|uniref:Zf-RVT domain-containing protein n=1 Tax=Cephalotus follicularis TaxID=3775 RepID=A0A1Q3BUA5_CEPFO|nr:zf-RVT domain-containing protein [Cephalotus follicularis]